MKEAIRPDCRDIVRARMKHVFKMLGDVSMTLESDNTSSWDVGNLSHSCYRVYFDAMGQVTIKPLGSESLDMLLVRPLANAIDLAETAYPLRIKDLVLRVRAR